MKVLTDEELDGLFRTSLKENVSLFSQRAWQDLRLQLDKIDQQEFPYYEFLINKVEKLVPIKNYVTKIGGHESL